MSTAEYLLKSFAAFATARGQTYVQTKTAIDWAALGPSVAQRDARLRAVCHFVHHVRVEDVGHELPPANHLGARKKRRTPHIYTTDKISRLVEAALRLRPMRDLRPHTQATLIALLSSTGLRISEALKLTIADVTRDGLLTRETKFRKTRLVPLHDTAAAGLQRYLARRGPGSDDDPVFIDKRNRPLRYIAVKETFDRLVDKAGIRSTSARRPRLHDLRHNSECRIIPSGDREAKECGRFVAFVSALSEALQECEEMVVGLVAAQPDVGRVGPCQSLLLELHVGLKIDGGGFDRLVAQPQSDDRAVDAVLPA